MNIIQCGTEIAMINGFGLTVDEFTELLRHQDSSPWCLISTAFSAGSGTVVDLPVHHNIIY